MAQDVNFFFKPQGPVSAGYLRSRAQRAFIMGPLGSGKTNASCWKAFRVMTDQKPNAKKVRRTRIAAIRNTYNELLGTTAKDWLEMFGDMGKMVTSGKEPPTHRIKFKLPDGTTVHSEMVFIALDRPEHIRKLRGYQLTAAMLSEVKELPFAILEMLDLRVGRFPNKAEGGPTWHGIFGDTNAPDTDHWYYRMAEEEFHTTAAGTRAKGPEGWAFFRQPGGLVRDRHDAPWRINFDAENLRNLPGAPGEYYLKGAQGKGADWVKVNLANEYGYVQEGKTCYPDYNDEAHCKEFTLVKELGIYIGLDFGLTPAAVIGQQTVSGRWLIRHELCMVNTGIKRFGRELNRFLAEHYPGWPVRGVFGDPAGAQREAGDTDESTAYQLLEAEGISAVPAPGNNDIVLRLETFSQPMREFIDGKPAILIHPECRILRKGCQGGYHFKRVQVVGTDRFQDTPNKNKFSHPCDAGQYLLLGAGEGVRVASSTVADNSKDYEGFRAAMGYTS